MDWLKRLQEKYRAKKLTQEQYEAKVKELLEDGDLTQDEHDKALEFDPKAPEGGELIYSQEDMDRMAVNVAKRLIRKEFKAAGIDLDVDNKGLLAHVVGLVKDAGKGDDGKGGAQIDEKELAQLRKSADKAKVLAEKVKDLGLEVAVLRNANGQYTPVSPVAVVRALKDYADEIEFDENDVPDKRSVDLLLRKLAKAEPYLFKTPEGGSEDDDKSGGAGDDNKGGGNGFSGKTPGGGTGGGKGNPSKDEAALADMLARAGVKTEKK